VIVVVVGNLRVGELLNDLKSNGGALVALERFLVTLMSDADPIMLSVLG